VVNSLRKVYLRFVLSINNNITYFEILLKPLNVIMAEMTSSSKLINKNLDKIKVRRSIVLLRSLEFHKKFQMRL